VSKDSSISKRDMFQRGDRISELIAYWKFEISQFEKWKLQCLYICIYFISVCVYLLLIRVLRLVFFGFGSLFVWFLFSNIILFWVFEGQVLCLFCFGFFDSWHVAKLSSFGPLELYSSWSGPRRDHLVGGENSLPHKKLIIRVHNHKIGRSAVLRQDGQCWNELCWFAYGR